MEVQVPIMCGDNISNNIDYADAIPKNMIAVARDILGTKGNLVTHDGIEFFIQSNGKDRGALYNERWKRSFRVTGAGLTELLINGSSINHGVIFGSGKASMSYSFQSILIVSEGYAFRFDGTTLVQMSDPDLGAPIDATWIDSYYFFTDGEYLFHTDIGDETSINPLKFATSELSPDPTKAVGRTQDNLVIVFNRYTTEYFINQGNENFAFSRINQKAVNAGIVGTHAWCEMDGNIFILGGRKEESASFHMLTAGSTTPLSTRYIDKILNSYTEEQLSVAVVESRIVARDKLIYLYLPNEVLLYNHTIAEGMGVGVAWSRLTTGALNEKWRPCNGIFDPLLNRWVYGDSTDVGQISYMNPGTASQYGQPTDMEFTTPLVPLESVSIDELELNTISGFNRETVTLFVSTTRDGAIYSQEWSKEVSTPYKYSQRCIYRRLGYVRKHIGFKFRCLSESKINVGGLVVRYG